jgi:hypothetical protein
VNALLRLSQAITALAISALLSGCAGMGSTGGNPGPAATAPALNVGDRWVYRGEDGYRVKVVWDETHEVMAAGPDGFTVRVRLKGPSVDIERTEKWSAPGIVREGAVYEAETDRFDPALVRYQYPLTTGTSWNQRIRNLDEPPGPYGPITRYVSVGGYESVVTPAGTFDAIRMRVIMQLDDETFWRYPTQCNYLLWYAPAVGAMVKEEKRSQYRDKGSDDPASYHPGQNALLQLVSFTRGR